MRHNDKKLRLREFNRFDIERILRENVELLTAENDRIVKLIDENGESLGEETTKFYLEEIANNSAQAIRIMSLLFYEEDILAVFNSGPLVRKEVNG